MVCYAIIFLTRTTLPILRNESAPCSSYVWRSEFLCLFFDVVYPLIHMVMHVNDDRERAAKTFYMTVAEIDSIGSIGTLSPPSTKIFSWSCIYIRRQTLPTNRLLYLSIILSFLFSPLNVRNHYWKILTGIY